MFAFFSYGRFLSISTVATAIAAIIKTVEIAKYIGVLSGAASTPGGASSAGPTDRAVCVDEA